MKEKRIVLILAFLLTAHIGLGQTCSIYGYILDEEKGVPFAAIFIPKTDFATVSDESGYFEISGIKPGDYQLEVSSLGYETQRKEIKVFEESKSLEVNFQLSKESISLDEIVVTATKTEKSLKNTAVLASLIDSKELESVKACNLYEGLQFQPGLRVETDCQTCNYTQLRMNGLAGGYTQILINGRPIFSPLTGLYGLEQIPANMIERIEVVRGGGSSLYGSSAIAGTVNVITNIPVENAYSIGMNYQLIDGQTNDWTFDANTSLVSDNKKSGVSLFFNQRDREFYDANSDNFSEIPLLNTSAMGLSSYLLPTDNQKLEFNLNYMDEYRFGGEMRDTLAHLAQQAEERRHKVWMGSIDYQINFNQDNSKFIIYAAYQNTDRSHYTGILPDDPEELSAHINNPPYGNSDSESLNTGFQFDHKLRNFILGENVITTGIELFRDKIYDIIPAYNYVVDQEVDNWGFFGQSDWQLSKRLNLLSGIRLDKHNLVDNLIASPRISAMYKAGERTRIRLSYGRGFRAPQAFDADLHIAFAGGGISRVILSPDLESEKSSSYSASIDYDKSVNEFVFGFTAEAFLTELQSAFTLESIGADSIGELFLKANGQSARVQGLTLELRANYKRRFQLETGFTFQSSKFKNGVEYIEGIAPERDFIRNPDVYGFSNLRMEFANGINANINYVFTGSMIVPHFAGAPNQNEDELFISSSFSNLSSILSYNLNLKNIKSTIELSTGIRNIFNAYQNDFDLGKDRDSNYIYGPAQPRSVIFGIKLKSL